MEWSWQGGQWGMAIMRAWSRELGVGISYFNIKKIWQWWRWRLITVDHETIDFFNFLDLGLRSVKKKWASRWVVSKRTYYRGWRKMYINIEVEEITQFHRWSPENWTGYDKIIPTSPLSNSRNRMSL